MEDWRSNIRSIAPYVPGEQPKDRDIIKLNTNESPYPPSPMVKKALRDLDTDTLRLYPDFVCSKLKRLLAEQCRGEEDEVFLGNGSDEVLALSFMTFFNSKKPVLFPDITYSFYDVWCSLFGIDYKRVPLGDDFRIKKEDYFGENGGIVIANPNAPTAIYMENGDIEDIINKNSSSIIIVDEAYIDFGGQSIAPLIHKYDNLVVVRTYSKSRDLAGIRLGYAFASRPLIRALEAVKNSFNSYTVSTASRLAAEAAAEDTDYFEMCRKKIIKTRENTVRELEELGFETLPSSANFIFTTHKDIRAEELFNYLKENKIYVRYFKKPRIDNYLRITIGTEEQMRALLDAVRRYLR